MRFIQVYPQAPKKPITLRKLESFNTLNSLRRIDKSQQPVSFDPKRLRQWYTLDFDVYLKKYDYNLQRPFVWTLLQQQELIWSIFMGRPIPPMVFIQHNVERISSTNDKMLIIDGKQRLTAIYNYIDNKFPIIVDGEEVLYNDLDQKARYRINSFDLRVQLYYSYEGKDEITDDEKIIIFNHYNFAGTPQEEAHKKKLLGFIKK